MKRMIWAACLIFLCAGVACKKDADDQPNDPGNNPGNPGTELPVGELCKPGAVIPGTQVQKEIGTAGGEIVLGNVKFVVPAGAFNKSVSFKVQRLLNTAPNGVDSLAFRFETTGEVQSAKPVKMIYTFPRDGQGQPYVPGGQPAVLGGVAVHKPEPGKTEGIYEKVPGKPVVDAAAGTATYEYPMKISNGKFDIIGFLKLKLYIKGFDGSKIANTTAICREQVLYEVKTLDFEEIKDELAVPIPSGRPVDGKNKSFITEIYINGKPKGVGLPFGRILPSSKEDYFFYEAPYVVPGGPTKTKTTFSIAVDVMRVKDDVSRYYLVSQCTLINESMMNIKGRVVENVRHEAIQEGKSIGINLDNLDHAGVRAYVNIHINDIFDGAGTYVFAGSMPKVSIYAANGDATYGMSARENVPNSATQYASGTIKITTYDRGNKIIKGTFELTLLRLVNGKIESAPVTGKFHIPLVVAS